MRLLSSQGRFGGTSMSLPSDGISDCSLRRNRRAHLPNERTCVAFHTIRTFGRNLSASRLIVQVFPTGFSEPWALTRRTLTESLVCCSPGDRSQQTEQSELQWRTAFVSFHQRGRRRVHRLRLRHGLVPAISHTLLPVRR